MPEDNSNADERTPLLRDVQSEERQDQSQKHQVEDLGPFTLQPYELYDMIGTKDVDALAEKEGTSKILEALLTDERKGLSSDQLKRDSDERKERERVYGKNELPKKQMKSFWRMLWEAFNDKVLIILSFAAVISFGLGLYQDYGPQHDPEEPRVQWIEGVSISGSCMQRPEAVLTIRK
jgi:Ca2+-transporting ATPase